MTNITANFFMEYNPMFKKLLSIPRLSQACSLN